MHSRRSSPDPARAHRFGLGLYLLYTTLLVVYYILSGGVEPERSSWWTIPLLSMPFLLALLLCDRNRPTDAQSRLRSKDWHDPRMHSAQER